MVFELFDGINVVHFIAAVAAYMAVGVVWYTPQVLGNRWMKVLKVPKKKVAVSAEVYGYAAANAALVALVVMYLLRIHHVANMWDAAQLVLYCWLGFSLPVYLGGVLWAKRPLEAALIEAGGKLACLLAMAATLFYLAG